MLIRKYIGQRLAEYYAQPSHAVVGSIRPSTPSSIFWGLQGLKKNTGQSPNAEATTSESIPFRQLWGERHWQYVFGRLYKQQEGQWLTPVELFQPYYSNVLAQYIMEQAKCLEAALDGSHVGGDRKRRVEIVELGGGRGTNAITILDYIGQHDPDLYTRLEYTIVDSSPTLQQFQQERIAATRRHSAVQWHGVDLLDVAEYREPLFRCKAGDNDTLGIPVTVVLALELLDNVPHDKVRIRGGTRGGAAILEQGEVVAKYQSNKPNWSGDTSESQRTKHAEIFTPLSDPLLTKVVESSAMQQKLRHCKTSTSSGCLWVPTTIYSILKQLLTARPHASVVLADFDWLPPPDTSSTTGRAPACSTRAEGEPLVTSMSDVDYDCYLSAPPFCDILFPTDFATLATYCRALIRQGHQQSGNGQYNNDWEQVVCVLKQSAFLQLYGVAEVEKTKSWLTGYTPLLHDFENCSILTLSHQKRKGK
jgi:Putative S-adenosyl-L-methionine-dependent methyltransferase